MTHQRPASSTGTDTVPAVATAGRRRGRRGPARRGDVAGPVVRRWLVAVAVLAGFVAMHGLTADHDVHALTGSLTGSAGGHHAPAAPAAPVSSVPHDAAAAPADQAVWRIPGEVGGSHVEDGCLVMLTISVLALVLALIRGHRDRVGSLALMPRAPAVLPARGPPRSSAPPRFALGVLRT